MNQKTWATAGFALLALGLAACSSSGGGPSKTPTPGAASRPGTTASHAVTHNASLTVWADDTRAAPMRTLASQFNAANGTKVTVVEKDFGTMEDDFISQAPTGKGPDVVVGPSDWLGKLQQNGVLAPLELGSKAGQFAKVALDAFTRNGKLYAVPYSIENVALVRNTALAPKAPSSWNNMIATGKALVKAGKAKFPLLIQQEPKSGDPYHLYPVQASFGAPVFGKDAKGNLDPNKLELGNAGGIKFARFLAQLGKQGIVSTSITGDVAKEAFLKGQAPYMITGPWNTPDFTKAGIKFALDPIPSAGGQPATPFVGVNGFYVSAKSKNPLLANSFVTNFLSTVAPQVALYKAGGRPPALTAAFDQVKNDPVIAGFDRVGQDGVPLPNIPAMDAVWADWGATEIAIEQGKGDPATLWNKMVSRLKATIKSGS